MGFTVNPLKIIRCDRLFNDPINDHFSLFPMHREFTNPDLRMAYYFQFILGILNALAVSHEGSMIKYFYNHLDNNLRVFAINGDEIFLHNIYYGKPGPQSSQTITTDTSNLKHFFRGLLLTSANSQLYNGGEAMLLEGKLDCVLSFTTTDVEVIPRKSVSVDVNSQVLHLTFITSDGRLQNLQFSTSSYSGEFGDIREWPMLTPNRLKSHIGEMLMYRNIDKNQVRKYTRDVQASLRDLTRAMDPRHKNREQCLSFIKGVMAHFQDSDSWTTQADISMALHMEVFKEIETVQVSLPMDEDADVIERILDDEVLETSAVKMAYNWHNDDFTMVGLNEEMSQYTTDNVHTACSSSLRKKRHMPPSGCLRLKKEDDAVKVDETKVKEMIVRKNALMEEHLTSIYEISGKIQVGLLARDFLGDVVRGDYKRLAVDTMFFGGLLVTQKLGRMASSAGARLGSVVLKSFGLCLPKLAFDAYMIYEIVEQIKTKDVQGAITTGVYLLLDLAECAAEIMVAFGLINPIIVPILAIASTLLLVGQAIYEAVAKVKEINHIIPLDPYEYEYEYFRELLHLGTDEYVQHLVDEKQANEFLASRVLKNYRNINRFLISAAVFKENKNISFIDNNIIDLTRKRTIKKRSRAMPDMKDDRLVFCSMYEEDTKSLLQKLGSGPFALQIMLSEVDLAGAMDTVDSIVISDRAGSDCSSPTNLTVHMRRHTHVQCTSSEANVTYLVADDMNSRLSVTADAGSHHFYFENMALNDMRTKELSRHYKEFQFVDKAIKLKIKGSSDISFEFNDGVKMVFTDHKATAYLKTTESIFEIMEKYAQLIENDPFITLVVETDEEKLVFNHNYHTIEIGGITKELNVIVDNDQTDAHLVAHREAENYFFLLSNHNVTNHKKIDLKIHTYGTISFIDLHQLARQIHAGTDSLYGLHAEARKVDENVAEARKVDDNVELELYMIHNRYEEAPSSIGKITLINVTDELDSVSIDVYQRNKLLFNPASSTSTPICSSIDMSAMCNFSSKIPP
uniref:Uncharacterized protein n=1 Tax=Romanomermis culicivorax TaxID=13658 RepID=A0A915I2P1_ROMCU